MTIDREAINNRLERLENYISKLKPLSQLSPDEFSENSAFLDIAERNLQVAIQICLDIGAHILASLGSRRPEEYWEIFPLLAEANVISDVLAKKLSPSASLRNLLVHEYLGIKPEKIFEAIRSYPDLQEYASQIVKYIGELQQT